MSITKNSFIIMVTKDVMQTRGVKLILVQGPNTPQFDFKWAKPVKPSHNPRIMLMYNIIYYNMPSIHCGK